MTITAPNGKYALAISLQYCPLGIAIRNCHWVNVNWLDSAGETVFGANKATVVINGIALETFVDPYQAVALFECELKIGRIWVTI